MHDVRIWIRKRTLKPKCKCRGPCQCRPRYSYDLRWLGSDGRWRSKSAGRDKKLADRAAGRLEDELARGTHTHLRKISWDDFVDEHLRLIPGKANAVQAKYALGAFGEACQVTRPDRVVFGTIETFVAHLKAKGNSTATINKALRYLAAAFNKAIKRSYVAKNPMLGWRYERENRKPPRIVTADEEARLLKAAKDEFGYQWWAFIYVTLRVGGRREEMRSLGWPDVDFERSRVLFSETKGGKDRYVPFNDDVLTVFRRLQPMTLQAGGPFRGMNANPHEPWNRIRTAAGVTDVTIHDMRRTFVTRLVRAGVPLPSVQKLAGHADIKTTLDYYNWVSDDDLRVGIAKLAAATG